MADASTIRVKARFSREVSEILPYLNTILKNGIYTHSVPSLTFTEERRLITIYASELFVGKLVNQTEAYQFLEELKKWINETHEKKHEIEPTYKLKKRPSAIEVYALLPQKNCRECGEMTCLAFATKLTLGHQRMENCTLLTGGKYVKEKLSLEAILG